MSSGVLSEPSSTRARAKYSVVDRWRFGLSDDGDRIQPEHYDCRTCAAPNGPDASMPELEDCRLIGDDEDRRGLP